ncbi:unnamed protein product [Rotaria sp. Silwood1]|nr:unnamed protein product [Rotaria sp. Silwood1]CAF3828210.1 unnamed protein product [Rotaria sp. Silwood1]CAF4622755.1 unnamed protein product [Rotaria sp. Silwood1]CAF4640276.1 unnamed protein product [Rotaria sp. Silwood1]CAF4861617.1 unnamed protein product [Rotaria sp. Silwood1]
MATSQGTTFTGDSTTISTTQTTVSAPPIVTEFETFPDGGSRITKLDQILLNGNHVAMLVPGCEGPSITGGAV